MYISKDAEFPDDEKQLTLSVYAVRLPFFYSLDKRFLSYIEIPFSHLVAGCRRATIDMYYLRALTSRKFSTELSILITVVFGSPHSF